MNNDITVEILRELWRYKTTDKYTEIEIRRALETAIEAVNGLRPHGEMRLIDADAFIQENKEIIDCEIDHPKYQDTIRELIDDAPTIKAFTLADIEENYRKGLEKGLEEAERPKARRYNREKAIEILQRLADGKSEDLYIFDDEGGDVCGQILEEQNAILSGIESLKDQRPHGEWVFDEDGYFSCSCCKMKPKYQVATTYFCPNCGADMRRKEGGE